MSTYCSIHFHIVFSTKDRRPWISKGWIDSLHEYIGGTFRGLEATPFAIGGVEDHVHALVGCKTTHRPSDLVRDVKKAASSWVHLHQGIPTFTWQDGYAIFSVSADACDSVRRYIANQSEHHKKLTFREELTRILDRAKIAYDERYLE